MILMENTPKPKAQDRLDVLARIEELAKKRGITSLIGVVHPENVYSCNNFKLANYRTITLFKAPYGQRLLKYKPLVKNSKEITR